MPGGPVAEGRGSEGGLAAHGRGGGSSGSRGGRRGGTAGGEPLTYDRAMSYTMLRLRPPEQGEVTLTLVPATEDGGGRGARGGVLVLPGGAYGQLAEHEAEPIAEALAARGFDAAVLRYRLGTAGHRHPAMIRDARLALRTVRGHKDFSADRWAVMGFSAGGHLASTLLVHGGSFLDAAGDDEAQRPDAGILCYAVTDLENDQQHSASRDNLLGGESTPEQRRELTTHRHVDARTPPTFLWHTADDIPVPVGNSLKFAQACREAGVPTELHVYESGPHGLALGEGTPVEGWFDLACAFLGRHLGSSEASRGQRKSGDAAAGRRHAAPAGRS